MQQYNKETAEMYSQIWGSYAETFANAVTSTFSFHGSANSRPHAIDLACGTGQLARVLCLREFSVLGIDASPFMLHLASKECSSFVANGQARFLEADIASFEVGKLQQANLITCSYDSINHLEDEDALLGCFQSVANALHDGGKFIFDMNTTRGLEDWNRIRITERSTHTVISRGFFDLSAGKAWKKFSGYRRLSSGLYERFKQVISTTIFTVY